MYVHICHIQLTRYVLCSYGVASFTVHVPSQKSLSLLVAFYFWIFSIILVRRRQCAQRRDDCAQSRWAAAGHSKAAVAGLGDTATSELYCPETSSRRPGCRQCALIGRKNVKGLTSAESGGERTGTGGARVMSEWRLGEGDSASLFHRTQSALDSVKKHRKERERLKSEWKNVTTRLVLLNRREAELLCVVSGLRHDGYSELQKFETELTQVQELIKTEMSDQVEKDQRLEEHLEKERELYKQILDSGGDGVVGSDVVVGNEEVLESVRQREAVQQELESLGKDMERLGKLIKNFDGMARASNAALLSRHASLERNRTSITRSRISVTEKGIPYFSEGGGHSRVGCNSDTEVLNKDLTAGCFRFPRVGRKIRDAGQLTPAQSPQTNPKSRKRQRSMLVLSEMERFQGETKKLERGPRKREVVVEVATSLPQLSREDLASLQIDDVESSLCSPSQISLGDSMLGTDSSSVRTSPAPESSPSSVLNVRELSEGTGESYEPTPSEGEVSCDSEQDSGGAVGGGVMNYSVGSDDVCSVVKKIDFEHVESSDMHVSSCSKSSITENTDTVAFEEVSVENVGLVEDEEDAVFIDDEFVCDPVDISVVDVEDTDKDDGEVESASLSESFALTTENEDDSSEAEDLTMESELESPGRDTGSYNSPSLNASHSETEDQEDLLEEEEDTTGFLITGDEEEETGFCSLQTPEDDNVTAMTFDLSRLKCSAANRRKEGCREITVDGTQQSGRQLALYADQVNEMRQTLDWFQENLEQEEKNRLAAEQQSERLSDLCAEQAMKLRELSYQSDSFEKKWKDLQALMDSKLEVEHQVELQAEASLTSSQDCNQEGIISEWRHRGEARNKLLEEQKQLLGDQLREGEKLRCALESKVLALRKQVEHLESSRQVSQDMGEIITFQNRAWNVGWRLTIQAFLFVLALYVWLQSFQSEMPIPLPT